MRRFYLVYADRAIGEAVITQSEAVVWEQTISKAIVRIGESVVPQFKP